MPDEPKWEGADDSIHPFIHMVSSSRASAWASSHPASVTHAHATAARTAAFHPAAAPTHAEASIRIDLSLFGKHA